MADMRRAAILLLAMLITAASIDGATSARGDKRRRGGKRLRTSPAPPGGTIEMRDENGTMPIGRVSQAATPGDNDGESAATSAAHDWSTDSAAVATSESPTTQPARTDDALPGGATTPTELPPPTLTTGATSRDLTSDLTRSALTSPGGATTRRREAASTANPFADDSFIEPTPDWPAAKAEWRRAWLAHIYSVGGLFSLLAVYSLYCLMRVRTLFLISRGYFVALNLLMLLLGVSRAFYMFVDAYGSHGKLPGWLECYLKTVGFPCLTAAFSVLFFALVRTTRMSATPQRRASAALLVVVIAMHFALVLATDVVVGYLATAVVLLFVCQVVYIVWALCATMLYFYVFVRLYHAAVARQRQIHRQSFTEVTMSGVRTVKRGARVRLSRAVGVSVVTAIFMLLCASLQCLAVILVYGLQRREPPKPWPYWTYQLVSRLCELGACATMSYVGAQPLYQRDAACCCCGGGGGAEARRVDPPDNPYWVNNAGHAALADRYYHTEDSVQSCLDARIVDDRVPLQARATPVDPALAPDDEDDDDDDMRPVSGLSAGGVSVVSLAASRPVSAVEDAGAAVRFHRASVHDGGVIIGGVGGGGGTEPSTPGAGPFGAYLPESSAPPWKSSYQRLARADDPTATSGATLAPPRPLAFAPDSFTEYDRLGYRRPIRVDSERDREASGGGVTFGKHRGSAREPVAPSDEHISNQSTFRSSWAPGTKRGYSILSNASPDERVYDEPILPRADADGTPPPTVADNSGILQTAL